MRPRRDDIVRYAYRSVGVPYKWGGDDLEHGVDCSGLARCVLQKFGLLPPGDFNSQMLYDHFKSVEASRWDSGNLLFFGKDTGHIVHVGICIGYLRMIEAAGGGSHITELATALSHEAFVTVSRIDRRSDYLTVVDPILYWERQAGGLFATDG